MDGAVKARSETFTPPALYAVSGIRGMAEISGQYFRAANELRARAQESAGAKGASAVRYVFPAVILYCACIESYFNEQLTLSATMVSNDELLTRIEYLKQSASPRERLREVFRLYDPRHMGLETDGELYRSLGALLELRNCVVHYSPSFSEIAKWPKRLREALKASKLSVVNAGWVTNFSCVAVADWSHATSKETHSGVQSDGGQNRHII